MDATELKVTLDQHKLWIESGRKKGKSANLQGANLWGAYLQGANFDLNFKKVAYFQNATFSEDQIAWVCLHPRYHEWADTLKWVKADKLSA